MMKVIFLDDGGVMNDNKCREPQWRELLSEFFASRYGGAKDNWKSANKYAFDKFMDNYNRTTKENPLINYNAFLKKMMSKWVTDMFNFVKIDPPPRDERFQLSREVEEWVTPRVECAYPGIIDTIIDLKKRGYTLCTASGEVSWTLKGYLSGMEVIDCFTKFYGPDLINTLKGSTIFYQKIVNDMKISPEDAIVVDDSSTQLKFAKMLGISTIHVLNSLKCEESSCDFHIDRSSELLDLMGKIH